MKENLISVIVSSIGLTLLASTVSNERLAGNVKALASLIIAINALNYVPIGFSENEPVFLNEKITEESVYDSVSDTAGTVYGTMVEDFIKERFCIDNVSVEVSLTVTADEIYVSNMEVYTDAVENVSDILFFLETEFDLKDKVSVFNKEFKGG